MRAVVEGGQDHLSFSSGSSSWLPGARGGGCGNETVFSPFPGNVDGVSLHSGRVTPSGWLPLGLCFS